MREHTIMATETKDRKPRPDGQTGKDNVMPLPHERDQSPDPQDMKPREVMKQAASDLEQGLVDTDLRGMRGVEKVAPVPSQSAQPIPKESNR
ncbi:MAG: hypothetical protein ACI83P_002175 [Janthinobacterium sp.]|jgi:hypothetical protein